MRKCSAQSFALFALVPLSFASAQPPTVAEQTIEIGDQLEVGQTVDLPARVSISGKLNRSTIKIPTDASFERGFAFGLNVDQAGQGWASPYPNLPARELVNFRLIVDNPRRQKHRFAAFAFGGSISARNLQIEGVSQAFLELGKYNDKVTFEKLHFRLARAQANGEYLINLRQLGDMLIMRQVDAGEAIADGDGSKRNLVRLLYANNRMGAVIESGANGLYVFRNSRATSISAMHWESGGVWATDSSLTIRDSLAWSRTNNAKFLDFEIVPFRFFSADPVARTGTSSITNTQTVYFANGLSGPYQIDGYDLEVEGPGSVTLRDVARWTGARKEALAETSLLGWRAKSGDDDLYSFNNYSHLASQSSRIAAGQVVMSHDLPALEPNAALGPGGGTQDIPWAGIDGTVFVRATILTDLVRRTGFRGVSRSYAVKKGERGLYLDILGPRHHPYVAVIEYGSSSGEYDRHIVLPVVSGRKLFFDGEQIGGFRARSGAFGPINEFAIGRYSVRPEDRGEGPYGYVNIAAEGPITEPAAGDWAKGDVLLFENGNIRFDGTSWRRVSRMVED